MKRLTIFLLIGLAGGTTGARTHQYDEQGRLIRVAYKEGGGIAYTYDLAGNMLSATTLDLPAAPTNFSAVRNGPEEAVLSWSDNADDETGYVVYRRAILPGGVQDSRPNGIASLPAGSTTYTDDSVRSQRNFEYWIVATNGDGESAEPVPLIAVDPTPFVIRTFQVEDNEGDEISITFPSNPGDVYAIEISHDLIFWDAVDTLPDPNIYTGGNGIFLGDFRGDETTVSIALPADQPNVFVKVVRR